MVIFEPVNETVHVISSRLPCTLETLGMCIVPEICDDISFIALADTQRLIAQYSQALYLDEFLQKQH